MAKLTQEEIETSYKPIASKEITIMIKASSFLPQKASQRDNFVYAFYLTLKNNHSLIYIVQEEKKKSYQTIFNSII